MSQLSRQSSSRLAIHALAARAGLAALVLVGLMALPLFGGAFARLAALLAYPYPHDGLEGTLLHEARLLWAGEPLYQPLELHRFVSAPYPPLHYAILGLVDRLGGPHIFWSGRLISLLAALAVATLIALLVRRAGVPWLAALPGVALFLSAPPVLLWATRIKPDLLALLWTSLGLFLAACAIDTTAGGRRQTTDEALLSPFVRRLSLQAAAICFGLAFFTKQTAVAAPLATGLVLLVADIRAHLRSDRSAIGHLPVRRPTIAFGLTYLALVLGGWLLLDVLTAGQFTAHVWGLHRSEWWSLALFRKFVALLAPYWPAMLLGAALLIRAAHDVRTLVPVCYLLVAPISLLGAGETGANHNHLLETILALAIATGIAAGWAATLLARRPLMALTLCALLIAQLGLAYRPQQWCIGELAPTDPPERYLVFMRHTPGEILADDVGLLFAAGRPLRYDDPSTMGPAARSGVWDQRGLLQEIAERRFSAIMIPVNVERETVDASGRWTPEMLAAIRAHYRLAFRDTIYTYVPK
jgi:hypothetical protein